VTVGPHDEELHRPLPDEFEEFLVLLAREDKGGAVDPVGLQKILRLSRNGFARGRVGRDNHDGQRPGGVFRQFGGQFQRLVGRGAPVIGDGDAFDLPEMFRSHQDRLSGSPDDRLRRGAEDGASIDVEMLAPLGEENPVTAFPAFFDNGFVDHPSDLFRFGMESRRLALVPEFPEDRIRFNVQAVFNGRQELLVGRQSDRAGDIRQHGSANEPNVHDMEPGQLRAQLSGDMNSIGDGRLSIMGAVGGNQNILNHGPPLSETIRNG